MIGFDIATVIKRMTKEVDNAVLGEIKEIAKENGLEREIILNEKNIVSALKKQIPKKATHEATIYKHCTCPTCKNVIDEFTEFSGQKVRVIVNYCKFCGQALDWGDTE